MAEKPLDVAPASAVPGEVMSNTAQKVAEQTATKQEKWKRNPSYQPIAPVLPPQHSLGSPLPIRGPSVPTPFNQWEWSTSYQPTAPVLPPQHSLGPSPIRDPSVATPFNQWEWSTSYQPTAPVLPPQHPLGPSPIRDPSVTTPYKQQKWSTSYQPTAPVLPPQHPLGPSPIRDPFVTTPFNQWEWSPSYQPTAPVLPSQHPLGPSLTRCRPVTTPFNQWEWSPSSQPTAPAHSPQHTIRGQPALPSSLLPQTVPSSYTPPSIAMVTANPSMKSAERPSLEDLLKDVPPEKLDQPCRDDHLCAIALSITRWKSIAPFLGLTKAEEENIEKDCGENETQKIGMLRKWREKFGRKATYRKLAKVFFKLERVDLVEEVCELLQTEHSSSSSEELDGPPGAKRSILDSYAEYLRGRYSTELPAFFTLQWPPPPTRKVFNLAMIGHQAIQRGPIDEELVRLTLRGGVDDIMRRKSSIELKNLFKLDNITRKIILIEGAPGAGKSTLAWHICQKWESGELFQEFEIVVFVQLRDPRVQAAKSLVDILPVESENMRSEVMSELQSCRGRNVLFVLDGWDEYGPGLQPHSFFQQLICSPALVNMHFSSLIITSRPIASGELQLYASSRVEIVGFTSVEVKKYFGESIGDAETEQKLQDHLRERPVIEASCYLPLNAAIVVHLFLAYNHTLPHTLHEVFVLVVLCCIIRHLTRLAERGKELPDISSLDHLPSDVQEQFNNICTMAYHGVMKNEVTFSATDLQSFNLPAELSTLSLIQAVRSFMGLRKSVTYNFLHLSVQELLAAFRISKLSATEQIQIFNNLFGQPRLAAVFQFYAAFTKLQTEGVRDIVARIVQKQDKPLLVNLLHGLYEAQDPSLCEFVASHLKRGLDLSGSTRSPMDCLVVGYFLSCVCLTTSGEFEVNLSGCSLDDYRIGFLIRELSKCSISTDARTTTGDEVPGRLAMNLRRNQLSGHGISSLLRVMNVITMVDLSGDNLTSLTKANCFPHLKLTGNQLGDSDIVLISDSLKTNTILKRISVARCHLSGQGGKAIGDALMVNRSLQVLDLHDNPGVVHIAESLKHNHSLLEINLRRCGITEKGCKAIGDALMVNRYLQVLDLYNNAISAAVVHITESLKHNHSLLEINLGNCGISEKGAKAICEALMVNRSLQVLDLEYNPISAGVVHIAESLKHNRSLLKINLGACGLTEKGAESLAISLKENNSLQTLILRGNYLSDRGDAHVADGLRHRNCLKRLDISQCGLVDRGMKLIGSALEVNNSLEELDLSENHSVTGVGLMALGESLKRNRGLKTLGLLGLYNISTNDWKQFIVCLQENNHLTELQLPSSVQRHQEKEIYHD